MACGILLQNPFEIPVECGVIFLRSVRAEVNGSRSSGWKSPPSGGLNVSINAGTTKIGTYWIKYIFQCTTAGRDKNNPVVLETNAVKLIIIDKWTVSVEATKNIATERLSNVVQDYGEYTIKRTHAVSGTAVDTTYAVTVSFDMIYDSANPNSTTNKAARPGSDYTLQYQNTSGQWINMTTPTNPQTTGTVSRYRYSVQIPTGQTEVKVRLLPIFDWEDEGVLFDSTGGGTPWGNVGEFAWLELADVTWPGKPNPPAWDPINSSKMTAKVEIKDGAYISIRTDSNNDNAINASDDSSSVKNNVNHPGRIMHVNYDDDDNNGIEDREQRIINAVPNNPAALAGQGTSVTVANENDLAEVHMIVMIDCLDPKDANTSATEIDVYFVAPNDLLLWTAPTKGYRLFRGENNGGRIDVTRRLKTLTAANKTFSGNFHVEGVAPIIGTVDLHAAPTAGNSGKDSAKFTCVEIGFVDEFPDYSRDSNTDSDNFFLRQHSAEGTADYLNLDIYYYVKPEGVKLDDVKIKIYEEDMGTLVTSIDGVKANGNYKSGNGLHVLWDDVRLPTGAFRNIGFYTVQLEAKVTGRNEIFKTPTGDADTSADWPGFQCKEHCLVIHDLAYKHRPEIHMGSGETNAPNGPVYPFSDAIRGLYSLWKHGYLADGVAWASPPANYNAVGFPAFPVADRMDYSKQYPVLKASIDNDAAGAQNHYINMGGDRGCAGGAPTLLHRGHVSTGHSGGNYCFIQYWMYETASYTPYNTPIYGHTFWHEGDWEMLQICIKLNHVIPNTTLKKRSWFFPYAATASQHYYGQTLAWRIDNCAKTNEILAQEYVFNQM